MHRAVKDAVRKAGITKSASSHTFRHSFASHLLADGYDIRTVQELLGHKNVKTAMIYTYVLNRGGKEVRSLIDSLWPKKSRVLYVNHITHPDKITPDYIVLILKFLFNYY